jgi:hypothetical protein
MVTCHPTCCQEQKTVYHLPMSSPFPGMDPYLEGYLWPDFHHDFASHIRRALAPLLQPRYVARIAVSIVLDTLPDSEIGIIYPDVEVLTNKLKEPAPSFTTAGELPLTAPLTIPITEFEAKVASVEVHDTADNELVTSIEILSPINKREPNLSQYRQKRLKLRQAGVHLIEIDLIRRGQRPFQHPRIPDVPYLITLTRAAVPKAELWPLTLQQPLPTIPVPLRYPDPDVPLNLAQVFDSVYEAAFYQLSIDYTTDPPPPQLPPADQEWWLQLRQSIS